MSTAKITTFAIVILALIGLGVYFAVSGPSAQIEPATDLEPVAEIVHYSGIGSTDLIQIDAPVPGAAISSPLTISGKARGGWYFEASFPVVLTDWDGLIIAEGHAEAQGDWMTEEFVPFVGTLEFDVPVCAAETEYCARGSLILQRSNASGLPEQDGAAEMVVWFR